MNWLMGVGLLFNTLGNIISGTRNRSMFPNFGMPVFSYPYYQSYPQYNYNQYQYYSPSVSCNDFYVGNTLAGLNTAQTGLQNYDNTGSIFNAVPNTYNTRLNNDNLVGNTLSSIQSQPSYENLSYTPLYTSLGEHPMYSIMGSSINPFPQISSYHPSSTVLQQAPQLQQQMAIQDTPTSIGKNDTIVRNGDYIKISKDIENRIKQMAVKLNCDYMDLIGMIWAESKFDKGAWNGKTAVGLIQFTQICIDDLNNKYGMNLTKQKIEKMSVFQQLDLAEKALLRAKEVAGIPQSQRLSAADLYTINFLPGRFKSHANKAYITKRGENFYAQNSGIDVNKDGFITREELRQFVQKGRNYVTTIA